MWVIRTSESTSGQVAVDHNGILVGGDNLADMQPGAHFLRNGFPGATARTAAQKQAQDADQRVAAAEKARKASEVAEG